MKIWITKYAISKGIVLTEGEICELKLINSKWAKVKWPGGLNGTANFDGKDYHLTEKDARLRANEMLENEKKKARKRLDKLNSLVISVKEVGK